MKTFVVSTAASLLLAAAAFAQPANDTCATAQPITGFGQTPYDTTLSDTDESLLIDCGTGIVRNDVWFIWTASATGSIKLDLCTDALHDTLMAVYDATNGCPSGLELACNDDSACGFRSTITLDVNAGQSYYVRVGGYGTADFGTGVLTITEFIPPPPNVLGGPFVYEGNGHTYYLLNPSSWTQAEEWAVLLGGHLATVRNIEENDFIFNSVIRFDGPNFRRGWIGLTDQDREQGDYIWTSGEPVTFTNWGGGEPNHANGTEFYAQIPWWTPLWNDNSNLPSDDPTYGVVEIISTPHGCTADLGIAGGLPGQDEVLDNNDFIAFINYFFASDPNADLGVAGGLPGSDSIYDNNDFIAFITFFFEGCGA